jgi:hypothetical protein
MTAGSTHLLAGREGHIRQRKHDVAELIAGAGMDMGRMGFVGRIRYRGLRDAAGNQQGERREGGHRRDA